jgi:hypothetical protein
VHRQHRVDEPRPQLHVVTNDTQLSLLDADALDSATHPQRQGD